MGECLSSLPSVQDPVALSHNGFVGVLAQSLSL